MQNKRLAFSHVHGNISACYVAQIESKLHSRSSRVFSSLLLHAEFQGAEWKLPVATNPIAHSR